MVSKIFKLPNSRTGAGYYVIAFPGTKIVFVTASQAEARKKALSLTNRSKTKVYVIAKDMFEARKK